jgi:ribonuclease HI
MAKLTIYTDGSCQPNPGPGGWAAYCVETKQTFRGRARQTTNNEMEMTAVLYGLGDIPDGSDVLICTDSKLVIGWLCMNYKTNENPIIGELRQSIFILKDAKHLTVNFKKILGHTGDVWNEYVDKVAKQEREFQTMLPEPAQKDRPCLHITLQLKNVGMEEWPLLLRAIDSIGGIPSGLVEEYNSDLEIVQTKSI